MASAKSQAWQSPSASTEDPAQGLSSLNSRTHPVLEGLESEVESGNVAQWAQAEKVPRTVINYSVWVWPLSRQKALPEAAPPFPFLGRATEAKETPSSVTQNQN